ncbi:MAG TPA: pyrroloquinoline quinone precursor peptide PqqA [Gemmatimonadales bacterium]|nr:pyrroloquinoline quinone precursor peptide PqqA [Gemmatimonadales bacterium]
MARDLHAQSTSARSGRPRFPLEEDPMTWTKPEFEVVELGMEVGAYAGNA